MRGLIRQEESIFMATPLRARAELGGELGDFRPHRRLVEKKKYKLPTAPSPIAELLQ